MATILTSNPPASPAPQAYPGAYRPGVLPGAAAGQYGAPLEVPNGPVVVFGSGHPDTAARSDLDRGSGAISGKTVGGTALNGWADGS